MSRYPVAVFWAVFAVVVTAWTVARIDAVYPFAALLAAVGVLARYRSWRWSGPAVAAVAALLVTGWLQGGLRPGDLAALAGLLAAAVLLGITMQARQVYLAEARRRAAAAERTRIAREVHDIVTHNLAVMVALADGAALAAAAAPERAAGALGLISATGREALDDMHRLLGLLREPAGRAAQAARADLEPPPGLDDLDALVAQVRAAGLPVTLEREGTPGPWGPGAGLTIYRLVQEALTNALRHAGPSATARIRVRYRRQSADLEITDDGGGPPATPTAGGRGLAGMRERVAAYDGRLDAGPGPAGGWRVRATLHFGHPAEPS